jgi:hypothetical protein
MASCDLVDRRAWLQRLCNNLQLVLDTPPTTTLTSRDDLNRPLCYDLKQHLKAGLKMVHLTDISASRQAAQAGRLRFFMRQPLLMHEHPYSPIVGF